MIPAKIIEISDKVLVEWPPEPDKYSFFSILGRFDSIGYELAMTRHRLYDRTIAEVENVMKWRERWYWTTSRPVTHFEKIQHNQSCQIEPTTEGKCRIIKIQRNHV